MTPLPPTTKAIANIRRRVVELVDWPMDTSPLKPDEVAGRTIATLISAGTEINGNFDVDRNAPWVGGYTAVFQLTAVGPASPPTSAPAPSTPTSPPPWIGSPPAASKSTTCIKPSPPHAGPTSLRFPLPPR